MRCGGTNSLTRTGNALPGLALAYTLTFAPVVISPSSFSIVVFHDTQPAPSVKILQTVSGVALIKIEAANDFISAFGIRGRCGPSSGSKILPELPPGFLFDRAVLPAESMQGCKGGVHRFVADASVGNDTRIHGYFAEI